MPTALDPKLVCGLALALIIGSLVGMERETGKALSGNVDIRDIRTFTLLSLISALFASFFQTLGIAWIVSSATALVAAASVIRVGATPGHSGCPRAGGERATWTQAVYLLNYVSNRLMASRNRQTRS